VSQSGNLEVAPRANVGLRDLPDKTCGLYQEPPYDSQPGLGGSIGVSDNNWSAGSFGGYIELFKEDGPVITCGLTCHHVLRPCKPSDTPSDDDCGKFTTFNLRENHLLWEKLM
jgi:hypothetical protein